MIRSSSCSSCTLPCMSFRMGFSFLAGSLTNCPPQGLERWWLRRGRARKARGSSPHAEYSDNRDRVRQVRVRVDEHVPLAAFDHRKVGREVRLGGVPESRMRAQALEEVRSLARQVEHLARIVGEHIGARRRRRPLDLQKLLGWRQHRPRALTALSLIHI